MSTPQLTNPNHSYNTQYLIKNFYGIYIATVSTHASKLEMSNQDNTINEVSKQQLALSMDEKILSKDIPKHVQKDYDEAKNCCRKHLLGQLRKCDYLIDGIEYLRLFLEDALEYTSLNSGSSDFTKEDLTSLRIKLAKLRYDNNKETLDQIKELSDGMIKFIREMNTETKTLNHDIKLFENLISIFSTNTTLMDITLAPLCGLVAESTNYKQEIRVDVASLCYLAQKKADMLQANLNWFIEYLEQKINNNDVFLKRAKNHNIQAIINSWNSIIVTLNKLKLDVAINVAKEKVKPLKTLVEDSTAFESISETLESFQASKSGQYPPFGERGRDILTIENKISIIKKESTLSEDSLFNERNHLELVRDYYTLLQEIHVVYDYYILLPIYDLVSHLNELKKWNGRGKSNTIWKDVMSEVPNANVRRFNSHQFEDDDLICKSRNNKKNNKSKQQSRTTTQKNKFKASQTQKINTKTQLQPSTSSSKNCSQLLPSNFFEVGRSQSLSNDLSIFTSQIKDNLAHIDPQKTPEKYASLQHSIDASEELELILKQNNISKFTVFQMVKSTYYILEQLLRYATLDQETTSAKVIAFDHDIAKRAKLLTNPEDKNLNHLMEFLKGYLWTHSPLLQKSRWENLQKRFPDLITPPVLNLMTQSLTIHANDFKELDKITKQLKVYITNALKSLTQLLKMSKTNSSQAQPEPEVSFCYKESVVVKKFSNLSENLKNILLNCKHDKNSFYYLKFQQAVHSFDMCTSLIEQLKMKDRINPTFHAYIIRSYLYWMQGAHESYLQAIYELKKGRSTLIHNIPELLKEVSNSITPSDSNLIRNNIDKIYYDVRYPLDVKKPRSSAHELIMMAIDYKNNQTMDEQSLKNSIEKLFSIFEKCSEVCHDNFNIHNLLSPLTSS